MKPVGLLWQIWLMASAEEYITFTYEKPSADRSPQVWSTNYWLENYLLAPSPHWLLAPSLMILISWFNYQSLKLFSLGLLLWPILEQLMHRYLLHWPKAFYQIKSLRLIHYILHGHHHAFPKDLARVSEGPLEVMGLAWLLTQFFGSGLAAGLGTGYALYDLVHYGLHATNGHFLINSKLWQKLRQQHRHHHYLNYHKHFQVSCPSFKLNN